MNLIKNLIVLNKTIGIVIKSVYIKKTTTNTKEETEMIKLYKIVNGEWKFVDYGVPAMADKYTEQGYVVVY